MLGETDPVVHLHVHSDNSILDGASTVSGIANKAAEIGSPGVAITDHGNMSGTFKFWKACREAGVNPIIGTEIYQAYDNIAERKDTIKTNDLDGSGEDKRKLVYHLTLLAENNTGLQNLMQLSSEAYSEGFWIKPRTDWDHLSNHSEGVIATTGCLGGHVLQHFLHGEDALAYEKATRLQDIFGKDNLFVEIQDHGIPEQNETNPKLIEMAKAIGAPLVVTNDSHYTDENESHLHDSLLCCATGAKLKDENRFRFSSDQHWIKTGAEMRALFPDHRDAADNTLLINERVDVDFETGVMHLPQFKTPNGETPEAFLKKLAINGARKRGATSPEYFARLQYELRVIHSAGFDSYFLILWDLVREFRRQGIWVGPGRGSAAASLVSYTLNITQLDPVHYGLPFERFLNPDRVSMPDVDLDISSYQRPLAIDITREKYGENAVFQVTAFQTMGGKRALRDAVRVMDKPFIVGGKLSKAFPNPIMGNSPKLGDVMNKNPGKEAEYARGDRFREMADLPANKPVVELAEGFEGFIRSPSVHAAAVIITPGPTSSFVPIGRSVGKNPIPIIQYDMYDCEELGLLKMDYLGLSALDIMEDAVKTIDGIDVLEDIPWGNQETFDMLSEGLGVGVFQLESKPMRSLMTGLKPRSLEDVAALIALYRPGPMSINAHKDFVARKNGTQAVEYFHPDAIDILSETQGLLVYQEQISLLVVKFCGYTGGEADTLRKIIGKKKVEEMESQRQKMMDGAESEGYGSEFGEALFDMIEGSASYLFNKAHAYAYGVVSLQTAYLKANYTERYMAALLTHAEKAKMALFIEEANIMGVKVLPPDINVSGSAFTVGDKYIHFGLESISSVGADVAVKIMDERSENGPFTGIWNFFLRCYGDGLTKTSVMGLVEAGAFDSLHPSRSGLIEATPGLIVEFRKWRDKNKKNPEKWPLDYSIESTIEDLPTSTATLIECEMNRLGTFLTVHPLDDFAAEIEGSGNQIEDIEDIEIGGALIDLVCNISDLEFVQTKTGAEMAKFNLVDKTGVLSALIFPKVLGGIKKVVENVGHKAIRVKARIDIDDFSGTPQVKLFVNEIETLSGNETEPLVILAPSVTRELVDVVESVCSRYAGVVPVVLYSAGGRPILLNGSVERSEDFMNEIKAALVGLA